MTGDKEKIILHSLINLSEFASTTLPFLKPSYFSDSIDHALFQVIVAHHEKYQCMPNKASLLHDALKSQSWKESEISELNNAVELIFDISLSNGLSIDWLLDMTESFCQEKAAYAVIMKSIDIYNNEDDTPKTAIPDLMREAVGISFDTSIGQDWFDDAEQRYENRHRQEARLPFGIQTLNEITEGKGVRRKTLNLILAGVNCGKTGLLCHLACDYARQGYNVLYISLEISEDMILDRIDANLLNVRLNDLDKLDRETYLDGIRRKTYGKIIAKEYPTGSAHSGHFSHAINELLSKRNIKVDVIIVDYLGICASSRASIASNSYTYQKSISEELRAMAVRFNAVCWSAIQLNRSGFGSSDVDMTDTADSFGVNATADMVLALTRTEELDNCSQVLIKQLKNRYGNKNDKLRFTLGVDQSKQQYFDVDSSHQYQHNTTIQTAGNNAMNKIKHNRFTGLS